MSPRIKKDQANKITGISYELPYNLEAENFVLGAMMVDPEAVDIGMTSLSDDLFSGQEPRNILVYNAMKELYERKEKIGVVTVVDVLITNKTEKDVGGTEYLRSLVDTVVSHEDIGHYIRILKDHLLLRNFLKEAHSIEQQYAEGSVSDISSFVSASYQRLERIANQREVGDFTHAGFIAEQVREQIRRESDRGNKNLTGIDTGYRRLNELTHGWQKGDFIVLAARPSVGKTAFALNLILNATTSTNRPVAFFSCEMGADQIMKRFVAARARVDNEKIMIGNLYGTDKAKVDQAIDEIKNMKIYIDDTPNPKLGDLVAKARKMKAQHPDLCLIVVDYLNLLTTETKHDSRANEVAMITRTLKEIARSLEVPLIALCQLNRNVDSQEGHVPMLSNLKESGSIEQDADLALLMHRSDYYTGQGIASKASKFDKSEYAQKINEQVEAANKKANNNISTVNINIAKNRNGQTGKVVLLFSKNYSLFDNPSPEYQDKLDREESGDIDPDGE